MGNHRRDFHRDWIKANAALESEIRARRDLEINLRIRESANREQAELFDLIHDAVFLRTFDAPFFIGIPVRNSSTAGPTNRPMARSRTKCSALPFPFLPRTPSGKLSRKEEGKGNTSIPAATDQRALFPAAGFFPMVPHVVIAADGDPALREFQNHSSEVDLLLLDVVLPPMSGPEV